MSGVQHGFPDKVTKALVRYREDTLRQKLISDAAAAYDDQAAPAGARPNEADPRYQQASAAAKAQWEEAAATQVWEDHTEAEVVSANPVMRRADAYLEPRAGQQLGPQVLSREARRRKAYRWLLILIILPLAGWMATQPVGREKVLTAVLASYGDETAVFSPVDGTIRRIRVQADGRVARGQLLVQIEPDVSADLVRAQREWVSLRLKESAIKARLAGESDLAYPIDMANAYPDIDIGPLLERARERLRDGEREEAEILGATRESIEVEMAGLKKVWAEKYAVETRLGEVRDRVGYAENLLKQNVIFEDGVYTEQLIKNLKRKEQGITQEFIALSEQEEQINERLHGLKKTLADREANYRANLRQELAENRAAADRVMAQLADLKTHATMVELSATEAALFEPNRSLAVGGHVAQGDSVGVLRIPSEKGVVESPVSAHEAEQIEVGQAVTVTLSDQRRNSQMHFQGRVVSLLGNAPSQQAGEAPPQKIRVEFNAPQGDGRVIELVQGMPGRVRIDTEGEPAWRYGWRALAGLVGESALLSHASQ